jgi:hypothetical protein
MSQDSFISFSLSDCTAVMIQHVEQCFKAMYSSESATLSLYFVGASSVSTCMLFEPGYPRQRIGWQRKRHSQHCDHCCTTVTVTALRSAGTGIGCHLKGTADWPGTLSMSHYFWTGAAP